MEKQYGVNTVINPFTKYALKNGKRIAHYVVNNNLYKLISVFWHFAKSRHTLT